MSGLYKFDDVRVHPEERVITRGGKRLSLSGKAFDVLVVLLKNHGRLVRRDQLNLEVWPDTHVDGGNLNVYITKIRKELGNGYVEAVPKQGYRFVADVIEGTEASEEESTAPSKPKRPVGLIAAVILGALGGSLYVPFHRKPPQSLPPIGAEAFYERALEYERIGDDEQALAALDQALALKPHYEAACVRAASLAYEIEQDQRARDYLARCKATDAHDEALHLKAQALSETLADNPDRALEIYQLLIDRYPHDTHGLYRFAELATNMDRLEEAQGSLQRCLVDEPDNPYCIFQSMYVKIKQNKFDDVLSQYKALPARVHDYPWFDEPVGIALFGKGELNDAKRAFARLSESQQRLHGTTHFSTAREWLADLLLYQGRLEDATRSIEQILGTSDNAQSRARLLAYLAQIYALTGDEKRALMYANQSASATPADPFAVVQAAIVLASFGDSHRVERLLKLHSEVADAPLSASNNHLIRGVLAAAKGGTASGIEEIRLARDLDPRDEEAIFQLGVAYFRAGDYESALKMFQRVIDLRGNVLLEKPPLLIPLSIYRIALCYEHLGSSDSAKPYRKEVAAIWSRADEDLRLRYLNGGERHHLTAEPEAVRIRRRQLVDESRR